MRQTLVLEKYAEMTIKNRNINSHDGCYTIKANEHSCCKGKPCITNLLKFLSMLNKTADQETSWLIQFM